MSTDPRTWPVGFKPRMVTGATMGLHVNELFGQLGPELFVTGHHSAGPIDRDDAHAIALAQTYHREHAAKGWGGIGYHYCITRRGTLLCLRPTIMKGAHVGLHNTSNIGVLFHGTTGDKPTWRQARTLRWLLANAHTSKLPLAHRTDRDLRLARRFGHHDWPGHETNACPGTHYRLIKTGGQAR